MLKNEPWATVWILSRVLGHSSKLSHNMILLCMHWIDRASYVKWTGVCLIPPQVQIIAHGLFLKYFCQYWATVWSWDTACSWAHSSAYTVSSTLTFENIIGLMKMASLTSYLKWLTRVEGKPCVDKISFLVSVISHNTGIPPTHIKFSRRVV